MNAGEITRIVGLCCLPYGKDVAYRETGQGERIKVTTVDLDPPAPTDLDVLSGRVLIDVHFFVCAIHIERADFYRAELRRLLAPQAAFLAAGPSYFALSAKLRSSEEAALMLMGLGEAMEFWTVITPEKVGLHGTHADRAAGIGFITISGFKETPQ